MNTKSLQLSDHQERNYPLKVRVLNLSFKMKRVVPLSSGMDGISNTRSSVNPLHATCISWVSDTSLEMGWESGFHL